MRRWIPLATAAAVLLSAAACTGDDSGTQPPAAESSAPAACDAAALSVAESGWSVSETDGEHTRVTFAGVLTPAGEAVANGSVDVAFLDASGQPVPWAYQDADFSASYQTGALGSGEKSAVTGYADLAEEPARVEFTVSSACTGEAPAGAVAVKAVEASLDGDELALDLAISSTVETVAEGFPIVVFRDAGGDITGGGPYLGVVGEIVTMPGIQPGEAAYETSVDVAGFLPEDVDLDATEVYIGLTS